MNDDEQTQTTLGFIARQAPVRTNVFDYLAFGVSGVIGLCGAVAQIADAMSDLLGAHANHIRARRQMESAADLLRRELGDGR